MNNKVAKADGSPSQSTHDLPRSRHSRRGSIGSVDSAKQLDKGVLSQTLDQINHHASQTGTLTTFNEYTSPPPSSSAGDGKEIQGGLSGLYSKLRASVGSVRETVTQTAEHGVEEEKSFRSPRLVPPSPTSLFSPKPQTLRSSSSSTTPANPDPSSLFDSRQSNARDGTAASTQASKGHAAKPTSIVLGSAALHVKGSLASNLPMKSPLAPVALSTATLSPTVADINSVADIRDDFKDPYSSPAVSTGPQTRAEEQLSGTTNKQKIHAQITGTSLEGRRDDYLQEPAEHLIASAQRHGERRTSQDVARSQKLDSDRAPEMGYFTPTKQPLEPPKIITHAGTPQQDQPRTPRNIESGREDLLDPTPTEAFGRIQAEERSKSAHAALVSDDSMVQGQPIVHQRDPTPSAQININPMETAHSRQQDPYRGTRSTIPQIRNRVLNKEFWMKDENARDCFCCGDSFSTFRRKHHCRTCGQIFDAKCTSILPGAQFGHISAIRVCKPCESIISGYEDSSEFSDDSSARAPSLRPRHGSAGASDTLGSPVLRSRPGSLHSMRQSPKHSELTAPTMSIPATRRSKSDASRKPAIVEIEAERTLIRPSSSRSLKSAPLLRPFTPGHRRHNSRHLYPRGFKALPEDSAPFHRNAPEEKHQRLPAFHDDNIIDPDLAPYLSDEGSSGDERIGIEAAMNTEGMSRSFDEKTTLAALLGSSKKGRSRAGDKSTSGITFASRDPDTVSLSSSRAPNARGSRRRNLSTAANVHLRPSPRAHRMSAAVPLSNTNLHESFSSSALAQMMSTSSTPVVGPRMIRSSSMRGAAAPAIELNSASLQHVRKLLRQLLQDSQVPSVSNWEKALIPILLQATDDVNPDVQNGDQMDIRHYVKLKKIPGGKPDDTSYVSGLAFTKNLALKSMPRSIAYPNILILTFPLEYARHEQHFMSLEPVIRQEREFLQNLVNRIAALQPNLLLVEKNVSGLALEFLERANIATAYNVKASVLEAVSRCAQTRIISSMDKLAVKPPQAGKCSSFYLKTYVHKGRRKTYMFLSGCTKELGCTIVLRGANDPVLAKMKKITEFMVYVVYNLKLETCLMRDEFALIPSVAQSGLLSPSQHTNRKISQATHADPAPLGDGVIQASENLQELDTRAERASVDASNTDGLHSRKPTFPDLEKNGPAPSDDATVPDDVPMPTFYSDMVETHRTKVLSASPFVKFMQPYLLMRSREQERRLAYLRRLRDLDALETASSEEKVEPRHFELITPEMVHETIQTASRSVREVLRAVHDAEYDKALHNYQVQSKQWETYIAGNINLFDPRAHQNIAVLYSVVCTVTTIPCSGPDMLALGFYNEQEMDEDFEADCTLGQYVEDLCLGSHTVCTANGCERKMIDHHRQYVHGEAQISVFVERYPCKLRGLQNTILMWSCCRICDTETQVMPMSESTWKYSFGKYLELSFWSKDIHARADVCPHDIHRDHLRYFGFKDLALRVHYDPITLLEVIVPRARITWKVDNDLRFKNDLYSKIEERINKFMNSVKARIKSIMVESVVPEKMDACRQEVTKLVERAREEHRALVRVLQDKYMTSKHYETVPFNQAIRATQEKVAEWDSTFADFDRNFFPSEKDIRRLATLQLKKIFLDKDDSNASVHSNDSSHSQNESIAATVPDNITIPSGGTDSQPALSPQTRNMSPEKAHDILTAVVDKHSPTDSTPQAPEARQDNVQDTEVKGTESDIANSFTAIEREEVRHLDLAISPELRLQSSKIAAPSSGEPRAIDFATQFSTVDRFQRTLEDTRADDAGIRVKEEADYDPSQKFQSEQSSLSHDPLRPKQYHASGIPRPTEVTWKRNGIASPPMIQRTHSHPIQHRREATSHEYQFVRCAKELKDAIGRPDESSESSGDAEKPADKKLSDRLGLGAIKASGVVAHSLIPRSVVSRKDSHVSSLAKHFEQLSREFEKERLRERRQRFSRNRQSRAYPMAAAKPIVEVYHNVSEAVDEKDPSDEDVLVAKPPPETEELPATIDQMAKMEDSQTSGEGPRVEDTTAENTETEETVFDSRVASDTEGELARNEADHVSLEDVPGSMEEHHALSPTEAQLDMKLDLPKHEKTSLMKMLSNFWAERSASGWKALDYPLNIYDHIFADSDIIVREDEPSSLIAFTLGSEDYKAKLRNITSRTSTADSDGEDHTEVQRTMTRTTGTHLKYQFQEGSAKMLCKVFYAEQFDAVRRKCGVSERIVEALSRCMKWDSKGGKTKSVFLKTLDDRFVLKSLPPSETQTFLKFAPAYFRLMSECLFRDLPSVIAKMLGFYQIIIKNPLTGVDFNWYLIVMENLFYDRSPTRIFDLKGSMRNRRIESTGEQNEVLLDENMVEFIYESPLFAREHSKKLLRASVWNDTLFLSRQNVMDYSLMIAIDEKRKELVIGIIDVIRTYTWDKKFEFWIKDRSSKTRPTITSPRDYKNRFREAMGRYVLQAPNCWHQFYGQQETRALRFEKEREGEAEGGQLQTHL